MEVKGILISQKEYERLTELEKNFADRIKENEETFRKKLEDAMKGNLVKILWVFDEYYAKKIGCDLSEYGFSAFASKEVAEEFASNHRKLCLNPDDFLKTNAYGAK